MRILKSVDLPTLGTPTTPIRKLLLGLPNTIFSFFSADLFDAAILKKILSDIGLEERRKQRKEEFLVRDEYSLEFGRNGAPFRTDESDASDFFVTQGFE